MIYVKLDGHDFRYDIEEIIRLFCGEEEICFAQNPPPEKFRGIFLLNKVVDGNKGFDVYTAFETDEGRRYERKSSTDLPSSGEAGAVGHARVRLLKREIRREIYLALSECTRKKVPWGMLTGIRPSKIAHELLDAGVDEQGILARLQDYYLVTGPKAELLYDVAASEKHILERTASGSISVYIGIPFCTTRCLYCSFVSDTIGRCRHLVGGYLNALKYEIKSVNELIREKSCRIQSIYIGGGTPTSLDTPYLSDLLAFIEETFDLSLLEEYTLEAGRPDSISVEKLEAIKRSKVGRISINPQTMNRDTLSLIGRNHTPEDTADAFRLARAARFNNINTDIIVGLPGEGTDMFKHTLDEIKKLEPESLTVHTLAIKRASKLNTDRDKYILATAEEAAEMIDMAQEYAKAAGMKPYYMYRQKNMVGNLENIGYCEPGYESIYNVQIMEERQTIMAIGAGGVTKRVFQPGNRIERVFNVKNVEEYISRVDEMVERKRRLMEL